MRDTSQIAYYDEIIQDGEYRVETKLVVNGVTYYEESLKSISTSSALFADVPSVGNCYSAEIDVVMIVPNESIPPMAEIRPYVRLQGMSSGDYVVYNGTLIASGSVSDKTATLTGNAYVSNTTLNLVTTPVVTYSDWIPQGVFYIDTREQSGENSYLPLLTIHGYDSMLLTEAFYPEDDPTNYPMLDTDVVDLIAQTINVEVDERTYSIMSDAYEINLPATYTMREVLSYIGSMYAGNWCMSAEGKLRLVGLTDIGVETNYLVDDHGDAIVFGADENATHIIV